MFWGECKRYTRANCDYSMEGLRATVPLALAAVTPATIHRHFEHVWRYMRAYQLGTLSNCQVEWAMRKYSSHRRAKEPSPTLDADFLSAAFLAEMPASILADKAGAVGLDRVDDGVIIDVVEIPVVVAVAESEDDE